MYSNEIREKFFELRAQNMNLRDIADKLGVHRNTLSIWARQNRQHIVQLRLAELSAIRALPHYEEELSDAADEYRRVTAELRTRDYRSVHTSFLADHRLALAERIDKLRMRTKESIQIANLARNIRNIDGSQS